MSNYYLTSIFKSYFIVGVVDIKLITENNNKQETFLLLAKKNTLEFWNFSEKYVDEFEKKFDFNIFRNIKFLGKIIFDSKVKSDLFYIITEDFKIIVYEISFENKLIIQKIIDIIPSLENYQNSDLILFANGFISLKGNTKGFTSFAVDNEILTWNWQIQDNKEKFFLPYNNISFTENFLIEDIFQISLKNINLIGILRKIDINSYIFCTINNNLIYSKKEEICVLKNLKLNFEVIKILPTSEKYMLIFSHSFYM